MHLHDARTSPKETEDCRSLRPGGRGGDKSDNTGGDKLGEALGPRQEEKGNKCANERKLSTQREIPFKVFEPMLLSCVFLLFLYAYLALI